MVDPATPFSNLRGVSLQSRDPSPRVQVLASAVTICSRCSSEVTARKTGDSTWLTQQKVINTQWLFMLLGWSCQGGPRVSFHYFKALGNPVPEIATAAAEGHGGRLLENERFRGAQPRTPGRPRRSQAGWGWGLLFKELGFYSKILKPQEGF